MKVLFIGGTGTISSACSIVALQHNIDLYHFNRGQSKQVRPIEGVTTFHGNYRNKAEAKAILDKHQFDVVVDWIAFEEAHIRHAYDLFRDATDQFIFISSASCYQKPPKRVPITEDTPLDNPFWQYARDKIACENVLKHELGPNGFPYTIVRPSHTYDKTKLPLIGGLTAYRRLKSGQPVVVHGDGTSLWTLTHHMDFAKAFIPLLGNTQALNTEFHITSDEWLSWNRIYALFGEALQVEPKIIHVPSEIIAMYNPELGAGLLGDKAHSMLFDNSRIREIAPGFTAGIPFEEGVREIVDWHENHPSHGRIDLAIDQTFNTLVESFGV